MSFSTIVILLLSLGLIIGGILLLKRSAKKFNLTPHQLDKINKRNQQLDELEKKED